MSLTILPGDEMKVLLRFKDFEGRHVMHCHNVVHEDHAMMIRWDMLPEDKSAFANSKSAEEVWGDGFWAQAPNPKFQSDGPQVTEEFEHSVPLDNRNDGAFQAETRPGQRQLPHQRPEKEGVGGQHGECTKEDIEGPGGRCRLRRRAGPGARNCVSARVMPG